ncbi:MAG: pyridoxine 5'-phosphate synthase [Gemmatimonadetes bacterium]|nr:pyridoxine 5'-phosphate synthase [Gemmatimonadota bacterium]
MRLYINVDHVATVRQARRAAEPDPVAAAALCERGGADGITVHLREDRRHIQDDDVRRLAASITTVLNLELATAGDILRFAARLRPHQATFVPERRQEITTEGGLDPGSPRSAAYKRLAVGIGRLNDAGVRVSLFIAPDRATIDQARVLGAAAVELHTGEYAHAYPRSAKALARLQRAAAHARGIGLAVHAGHGLTYLNVTPVAAIPEVEELNIGHSIVSRSITVGMETAVREMRSIVDRARATPGVDTGSR